VQLGADTWFYAKRCFLALLETLAKHMCVAPPQALVLHTRRVS
jgi:hypothetical protein